MSRDTNSSTPESAAAAALPPNGWVVYLLRCADNTLYVGVTADLERRLRQHNGELAGGARYTQGRRPVAVVWSEDAVDRSQAQRREHAIKRLSRGEKERMLAVITP